MTRLDRLYALREELRRAGPAGRTAEQLAQAFEVSVRTIKRDISALQHGGFPVWARPGPGGGYVVDAAATLPPVNLTAAEVSGLAAAVAAHRGQPFDGPARAALVKVLGVMGPPAQARASALTDRVWIDHVDTASNTRARRAVEQALSERRMVNVRWVADDGRLRGERLDPVFLARTQGRWFFVGSRAAAGFEFVDIDRIESARLSAEPSQCLPVASVGTPPVTAAAVTEV